MGIAYNTSIVRDGLVLHLDAANVKSYPGTGTTWSDLKNSNDASAVNTPEYSSTFNGIFAFDGASDYFTTTYNMDQNTGSEYTCCAFARLNNTGNGRIHILSTDNGGFDWSLGAGDFDKFIMFTGAAVLGGAPQDTNWHMHTGIWSSTGARLYMDAILQGSAAIAYDAGVNPVYIGKNPGYSEYWNGDIGCVLLYNRVLSENEILRNFEAMRGRYGI